jgi:hypothetical protein
MHYTIKMHLLNLLLQIVWFSLAMCVYLGCERSVSDNISGHFSMRGLETDPPLNPHDIL